MYKFLDYNALKHLLLFSLFFFFFLIFFFFFFLFWKYLFHYQLSDDQNFDIMNICRAQRPLIISFLLFTIGKSLVKLLYSQIFLMIRQELELLVLYRNFVYFMLFSDIVRKYISLLYQSNESITNESTGQCLCTIALLYSIPNYQKKC